MSEPKSAETTVEEMEKRAEQMRKVAEEHQ
jgi:hypothetical protein